MLFARRTLVWRYFAVASFTVYVFAFGTFLCFLTSSPTTFSDTDIASLRDWFPQGFNFDPWNGTNFSYIYHSQSSLLSREDIIRRHSHLYWLNESFLENLQRNMTLLKANMSGVNEIVQGIIKQPYGNKTIAELSKNVTENSVNPHPFKYLINCPDLCKTVSGELLFVAYIHTAPDHYKRRMVIRQTWGDPSLYDVNMRLVFVMGYQSKDQLNDSESNQLQQALIFESGQYGDIVQEDFLDSYRNLTYKGIAALKWIANYCSHAKFVVKTDDDIFVNSFSLIKRLKRQMKSSSKPPRGTLMCLVWKGMVVMRQGKWKVDEREWKEATYPTYCSGSAFIMSTDLAINLHKMSYHVPFFWVDDFYVTGLLPLKLGNITHTQIASSYVLNGRVLEEKFTGPQWYQYLFSHVHDLNAILAVWRKLLTFARGEAKPVIQFALPGHLPDVPHRIDP